MSVFPLSRLITFFAFLSHMNQIAIAVQPRQSSVSLSGSFNHKTVRQNDQVQINSAATADLSLHIGICNVIRTNLSQYYVISYDYCYIFIGYKLLVFGYFVLSRPLLMLLLYRLIGR